MSERKFRQHPFSFVPGGCVVKTVTIDGRVSEKDWIKYPERYVNEMLDCNDIVAQYGVNSKRNTIAEVYVDGELVWDINDQDDSKVKHEEYEDGPADEKKARRESWDALANVKRFAKRRR